MLESKTFAKLLVLSVLMGFSRCTSPKNLIYFQDEFKNSTSTTNYYSLTFQRDDLLSITVLGLDPEAVLPFNLPISPYAANNVGGYTQGAPTPPGYLIDEEGNIDFPVIGKIHLEGLTRTTAVEKLKSELKKYINNPTVNIRVLNYKVTVLGEVRNPGTFTIPNERVTLPEAIGIAGDLLITGVRDHVTVIREENGKKTETIVNLKSKELFNSPVYYLKQNDVVYVAPNRAKINSSAVNASNVGIAISVASLLVAVVTLIFLSNN